MESEENSLLEELRIEKLKTEELRIEVEGLKQSLIQTNSDAEFGNENVANRLLRRIRSLSIEREELQQTLDQKDQHVEELQDTLRKSERSAVDLQHKMEVEQEFISNQLQKKIAEENAKRRDLERRLSEINLSDGLKNVLKEVLHTLGKRDRAISNTTAENDERGVLVSINQGIQTLIQRNKRLEDDNEVLRTHQSSLKNKAYSLEQRIHNLQREVRNRKFEQAQLIGEIEIADESSFNLGQKRHSISSQSSSRSLSASVSVSSLDAQDSLALEKRQKAVFQMMTHSPERKPEQASAANLSEFVNIKRKNSLTSSLLQSPTPVDAKSREDVAFERLSLTESSAKRETSPSPQRARSLSQTSLLNPIKPGQIIATSAVLSSNEGEMTPKTTQQMRSPLPRPASTKAL